MVHNVTVLWKLNGRQQYCAITSLFISLLSMCSFHKLVKSDIIIYTNITYKFRFSVDDTTKCVKPGTGRIMNNLAKRACM